MPYHKDTLRSKHKTQELFDIVADVEKYPEFLPWVAKLRIVKRISENEIIAEMLVKFAAFTQKYTSRIEMHRPDSEFSDGWIKVSLVEGPFKTLSTDWEFHATEDADGNRTEINFVLDFEFKSSFFEKLVGTVFEKASMKMSNAFLDRAEKLYPKS
jgi:coenzyme Q-binding protein COQ10